ncbi:MAG TPA: hypothetical protein VLU47_04870 [Blastocatellia bacterium]|nr:hypothetical protein [Blastocatellia bacterium]
MLDDYRLDYAAFNAAYTREYYLFLSGQKTPLEISPIYDRYGDLFTQNSIESLRDELSQTPEQFETQRAGASHLLIFAVEQYLENSAKQLTAAISEHEASATIRWKDREITFQDATAELVTERDRSSRQEIFARRAAVIEASNDLRYERLLKLHAGARSLGVSSYVALFEDLKRLDYLGIARASKAVLIQTEAVYLARLDEALLREVGSRLEQPERHDAIYLLHLTRYDDRFPAGNLLEVYAATMAGLGIKVASQGNILIDGEQRPRKTCRAFCMPISVPDEIRLVIRPVGGQSDYQSLFHEIGHAQHYGWAAASLPPEFKYTGDYALTETYAFLFNHLISDRSWLAEFLGLYDSREFVRAVILARLVTVRRYVAKLAYEYQLHLGGDIAESALLYAELQTEATKFKTETTEFLFDLDDSFYSAGYLRAWALEVALRDLLKTRFGTRWWASRRAGDLLKQMWETGDRHTADEMASQVGVGPISFDLLIDEFNRTLKH